MEKQTGRLQERVVRRGGLGIAPVLTLSLVAASTLALSGCNGGNNSGFANVRATVISGAGDIQDEVDQFRALLGTLNSPTTPAQTGGRREVNWDGVPDAFSNSNNLPGNFFNPPAGSPGSARGLLLSTPGSGLRVSGTIGPPATATLFSDVNNTYPNQFAFFTPNKTFAANGSNRVICTFEVRGQSGTTAGSNGFGVVFSDVDSATSTFLDFFEGERHLGRFLAPVRSNASGLSFLGVFLPDNRATRVEITAGNAALGAGVNDISAGGNVDLVVMDDFIYGEPQPLQ